VGPHGQRLLGGGGERSGGRCGPGGPKTLAGWAAACAGRRWPMGRNASWAAVRAAAAAAGLD
jgi:hypothetical protein